MRYSFLLMLFVFTAVVSCLSLASAPEADNTEDSVFSARASIRRNLEDNTHTDEDRLQLGNLGSVFKIFKKKDLQLNKLDSVFDKTENLKALKTLLENNPGVMKAKTPAEYIANARTLMKQNSIKFTQEDYNHLRSALDKRQVVPFTAKFIVFFILPILAIGYGANVLTAKKD